METKDLLDPKAKLEISAIACPACQSIWLAPGLKEGDRYECRNCRHRFVISRMQSKRRHAIARVSQDKELDVVNDSESVDLDTIREAQELRPARLIDGE
jgi:DNA-directed RNA polymerase subunit M/transcription elongation factor TFIIS